MAKEWGPWNKALKRPDARDGQQLAEGSEDSIINVVSEHLGRHARQGCTKATHTPRPTGSLAQIRYIGTHTVTSASITVNLGGGIL